MIGLDSILPAGYLGLFMEEVQNVVVANISNAVLSTMRPIITYNAGATTQPPPPQAGGPRPPTRASQAPPRNQNNRSISTQGTGNGQEDEATKAAREAAKERRKLKDKVRGRGGSRRGRRRRVGMEVTMWIWVVLEQQKYDNVELL